MALWVRGGLHYMTPVLVFDIETVPDIEGLRNLHGLGDLEAHDIAEFAFSKRRAKAGTDFLPLHLHQVVAISCALREGDTFRVWSLGRSGESEASLIKRFYDGVDRYTPQLVSWNGGGFDLPVLNYRALVNGISASRFWEWGDEDRSFGYNNYVSRYHKRHIDLMDLLSMYQPRATAPLDSIAQLCGFPGKIGLEGSAVWGEWSTGGVDKVRAYCEADVANTYLVWLRFQLLRGVFDHTRYDTEIQLVRNTLGRSSDPHWLEFLELWNRAMQRTRTDG